MPKNPRQAMNCLVLSGRPISDNACGDLLLICCAMARSHKNRFDVKTDEMEGRVETIWTRSGMGGIWGYVFSATLETNLGTTYISYIIDFSDLERIEDLDMEVMASSTKWAPWGKN